MRRLASTFVLAATLAMVAGCAGSGAASEYAGTVWTLDRIVAADGGVTRGTGEERLTFGADGQVSLASCNQCSGPYRIAGATLTLGETMACTRRGCPEGAIELERYLSGQRTLRREGSYLVVESADASGVATQLLFAPEMPVAPTAP